VIETVRGYYEDNVQQEWERLETGLCRAEFASTMRLVRRHFPAAARVCDIGAGPGRYSIELARVGHRVTVFDLAHGNLVRARLQFTQAGLQAEAYVQGSATDLGPLKTASYGAALLLGPLMHLTSSAERHAALLELRRVMMPGATGIVAYLNSWGLMRTGMTDFPATYADAKSILALLQPQTFEGTLRGFTDCHWSTPPEAQSEVQAAGFRVITYAGVEGFAGGMHGVVDRIAKEDPVAGDAIVTAAAETSELPQYRDATDHLHLVVCREG